MPVLRVLHGKLVQPELMLHLDKLVVSGVAQCNPDETLGLVEVAVDVFPGDIGQLLAILIDDAIDEHECLLFHFRSLSDLAPTNS